MLHSILAGTSSMAAHIALHEAGASFEKQAVSVPRKETRKPEFLAVNPVGKVPVLMVNGRPLTEVAGSCSISPAPIPRRGSCRPATSRPRRRPSRGCPTSPRRSIRRSGRGVAEARELYAVADKRLGDRKWILGDRYSIADIHLFRVYWRFRDQLERQPGDFPALEAHYARMMERPAVKKTIEIEAKA